MANELWLYDVIGEGFWSEGLTGKSVRDALAEFDRDESLSVRINSPGGDVFEAQAIRTLLAEWPGGVDVQIDGVAASAASFVATVGREVTISDGAMLMIHRPWSIAIGDEGEMERTRALLQKTGGQLANAYSRKSGRSQEEMLAAMEAETWYTAEEAVDAGLADAVVSVAAAAWAIPAAFRYANAPKSRTAHTVPLRGLEKSAAARQLDKLRHEMLSSAVIRKYSPSRIPR